jgi:cytochrome-b5 reductase
MATDNKYVIALGVVVTGGAAYALGPAAAAVAAVFGVVFAWRNTSKGSKKAKQLIALDASQKIPFALAEKINLSHDTRLYRFALQTPEHILGLPIGQHMFLSATINDKPVSRAYTPVSSDDDVGRFDLVVKVYPQGNMSRHLDSLNVGDTILVQGPRGRLTYAGMGEFLIRGADGVQSRNIKRVGMMAGGTGITPMLQVITAILKNPLDKTQINLIFANQTEQDILCRSDLERLSQDPRFKVWYTVDRPADDWKYSQGFITAEMIQKHLPAPADDVLMLMCGPPPMVKFACVANLEKLGFKEHHHFAF